MRFHCGEASALVMSECSINGICRPCDATKIGHIHGIALAVVGLDTFVPHGVLIQVKSSYFS